MGFLGGTVFNFRGDGIISKPHMIVLSLKLNLYDSVVHDDIVCANGLFKMLRINILVTVSKLFARLNQSQTKLNKIKWFKKMSMFNH